jgi:16S rRNA processing protein RimM
MRQDRPHGVHGLAHVTSYTARAADLAAYGPLLMDDGRSLMLAWRSEGVAELAVLDGERKVAVVDRASVERLTNFRLWIDRGRLPPPAPDEYYLTDLIGLQAFDQSTLPLGVVAQVHDYGGGPSLEIVAEGRPPLLVPFTRAAVPEVDLAMGRIRIDPPATIEAARAPGEAA